MAAYCLQVCLYSDVYFCRSLHTVSSSNSDSLEKVTSGRSSARRVNNSLVGKGSLSGGKDSTVCGDKSLLTVARIEYDYLLLIM
jgi:hypothetical protein